MPKNPQLTLLLNKDLTPHQSVFCNGNPIELERRARVIRADDGNLRTLFMIIGFTVFARKGGEIDHIPPEANESILRLYQEARRKKEPSKENSTWFHEIFGNRNPRLEGWIEVRGGEENPFIRITSALDVELRYHKGAHSGRELEKDEVEKFYKRYLPISEGRITISLDVNRGEENFMVNNHGMKRDLCFMDWVNIVIDVNFSAYFLFIWIDSEKGVKKLHPNADESFENIMDSVEVYESGATKIEVPRDGGRFPVDKDKPGTEIGVLLVKREKMEVGGIMERITRFVEHDFFQVTSLKSEQKFTTHHLQQTQVEFAPPKLSFGFGDMLSPDGWQDGFQKNLSGYAEIACLFSIPKDSGIIGSSKSLLK